MTMTIDSALDLSDRRDRLRAEVRSNLKHSHNMVRGLQPAGFKREPFHPTGFAKFI